MAFTILEAVALMTDGTMVNNVVYLKNGSIAIQDDRVVFTSHYDEVFFLGRVGKNTPFEILSRFLLVTSSLGD